MKKNSKIVIFVVVLLVIVLVLFLVVRFAHTGSQNAANSAGGGSDSASVADVNSLDGSVDSVNTSDLNDSSLDSIYAP